jgi:hypothetical protein
VSVCIVLRLLSKLIHINYETVLDVELLIECLIAGEKELGPEVECFILGMGVLMMLDLGVDSTDFSSSISSSSSSLTAGSSCFTEDSWLSLRSEMESKTSLEKNEMGGLLDL